MLTFDIHCHFFPRAFLDEARKPGNSIQASIETRSDGQEYLICAGNFDHPLVPNFYSAEHMIQDMDAWGMRMAAISAAPPTLSYWADPAAAVDLAAAMNESTAERMKAHPDRFVGLATVPLQDIEASVREARRAVHDLGLSGFQIGSNVDAKNLDHPDFEPLFATLAELNVPVFIHPYIPAGAERMQDYYLHNLLGMVAETGLAIGSVIYGGIPERWPGLKLVFAHAGGVFPYIHGRMDHGYKVRTEECRKAIPRPPSTYMKQLYFDCITFQPRTLRFLVDLVGADHVLIGTDYPFDMGPADPVAEVMENPYLNDEEKRQICGGTAAALFGIESEHDERYRDNQDE